METQFEELKTKINNSKDFEQIRYAHDTFLTKIQAQSFILNNLVIIYLDKKLNISLYNILKGVKLS